LGKHLEQPTNRCSLAAPLIRCLLQACLASIPKVHDYWYQYEWQARGTGYIHAIIWIDDALMMGGMKKEEVRARFAAFWSNYITAVNLDVCRPLDIRNPASLAWHDVRNMAD
jgi:hypothetical protein